MMGVAEFDGAGVAGGECSIFTLAAAVPDRTDSMNHMPRRQPITSGDLGVAGAAAVERPAFRQQLRSGRAMNGAIHPATAKQRAVGGVDNGIDAQAGDVGDDDLQPRRTELARGPVQAEAAAPTATPLSEKSFCNSPAWNISRMMSQPPTNSPLT
jgi:hypothetical protein